MSADFTKIVASQLEAGLCMLNECIRNCPAPQWDENVGKYPFWHVAYHTLCFVDVYLTRCDAEWQPRHDVGGPGGLHPKGREELEEEYPSRRFEPSEMLTYVEICREKIHTALAAETPASLAGESGFPWLPFTRAELHLYNLRHLQHHAGQLSALLRRAGVDTGWVKAGWR